MKKIISLAASMLMVASVAHGAIEDTIKNNKSLVPDISAKPHEPVLHELPKAPEAFKPAPKPALPTAPAGEISEEALTKAIEQALEEPEVVVEEVDIVDDGDLEDEDIEDDEDDEDFD